MAHNPTALLVAALQTERPELLQAFIQQMGNDPNPSPEVVSFMIEAIGTMFQEIYDLRRTIRAMGEAQRHVHLALRGCQKHLATSHEVANRGLAGNLPEVHDAASLLTEVRAQMDDENENDDED